MDDLLRSITIMAAMAGISASACCDENELCTGKTLDNLLAEGKKLGIMFHQTSYENDESSMSSFYEEFGKIISGFKHKQQIDAISKSFSDETLTFTSPQAIALSFMELKMRAVISEDPTAVSDVENAFYQTVEKCKSKVGEETAGKLINYYDYYSAGATLGHEYRLANLEDNKNLANSIKSKAISLSNGLSSKKEFNDVFRWSYDRFST